MTTPTWQQAIGVVVVVLSAVVSYLLAQTTIAFEPIVAVVLGAANIALTTLALTLNIRRPTA